MAIAWSRRSLSTERPPAGPRLRCCSGGSLAKHRASWLAALLLILARGSQRGDSRSDRRLVLGLRHLCLESLGIVPRLLPGAAARAGT
jgi:hypothetical protein